jgi:hypothetical protein
MIQSHERNIKPFKSGWRNSGVAISNQSDLQRRFSVNLKIPINSSRNHLSPEENFRLLVSSNPLLIFCKLTCRWHQITVIDVLGPGSGHWPVPACREPGFGQSSRIWPFLESHLLELGRLGKSSFGNVGGGKNSVRWLAGDWKCR